MQVQTSTQTRSNIIIMFTPSKLAIKKGFVNIHLYILGVF